jgi:glutamate-1-semialdehyde 2,1-aminomutase
VTGRQVVAFFDGHYHGHLDESLVALVDGHVVPDETGLPDDVAGRTLVLAFNDLDVLERALSSRSVAAVVTEPAITNNVGLVLPDAGFHEGLREITRRTGTVLVIDETHTQVVGPGGLTRIWSLEPDILTIGKSIAGGVPLGAYGMRAEIAEVLSRPLGREDPKPLVATGGTLFGNALSMSAARATMSEALTDDAYARANAHGSRLADGLEVLVTAHALPWTVHRFWPRTGFSFTPSMPHNGADAVRDLDVPLRRLMRVYLANRGVWDAIVGAGPTCSTAVTDADVDTYLAVAGELLDELVG